MKGENDKRENAGEKMSEGDRKMKKAYFNWSSGKDSALALYRAMNSGRFAVESLFSVIQSQNQKISMHETGVELLKRQAKSIGIPLTILEFDPGWPKELYGNLMARQMEIYQSQGIETALFGDLYLEPLRRRREQNCAGAGIKAEFPLWKIPQKEILSEFLRLGFRAVVTCVDGAVLSEAFLGRTIDEDFISALPEQADICGENGEYHSFVFDGPIFRTPIQFEIGKKICRDYPEAGGQEAHRYWYLEME